MGGTTLDGRMETNALFLLLNQKAENRVDPNKPVIMIAPETQMGTQDHPRVKEGMVFNTDQFDPEALKEGMKKWGNREVGQSEVTHMQVMSRFPDGTSKNLTFVSMGKFGVDRDPAPHETVAGRPAEEFIDEIQKRSAKITPDMQTVTDYDTSYGQPAGYMKLQQNVVKA